MQYTPKYFTCIVLLGFDLPARRVSRIVCFLLPSVSLVGFPFSLPLPLLLSASFRFFLSHRTMYSYWLSAAIQWTSASLSPSSLASIAMSTGVAGPLGGISLMPAILGYTVIHSVLFIVLMCAMRAILLPMAVACVRVVIRHFWMLATFAAALAVAWRLTII